MDKRLRMEFHFAFNRKSKTCTELSRSIQNLKWAGFLAILVFLLGRVEMAEAQQGTVYRVGILSIGRQDDPMLRGLRDGLKEARSLSE